MQTEKSETLQIGARTVVIKQIGERWWMLTSSCAGEKDLIWFGYSRAEVLQKFRGYIRDMDLDKITCKPRTTP